MATKQSSGIVLLLCGVTLGCQRAPADKLRAPESTGWVNGSVATTVTDAEEMRLIYLPGVTVQLRLAADGQPVATVVTDRSGNYVIGPQPSGRYQLCWEAPGFIAGCSDQPADIQGTTFYAPTLELAPEGRALFGRVVQRDGRPCNYRDAAFGVDARAQVTVLNATGRPAAPPVEAGVEGEYLVPGVPFGQFSVRATCEGSSTTVVVRTEGARYTKLNLTLPNTSPELSTVAVTASGRGVYRVRPGATVQVTANARDADGDRLHYRWFSMDGSFASADSASVDWTLPDGGGLHMMYLLVSDGKGGYAYDRVEVSTDDVTQLAGHVVDEAGAPVAEALVSVGHASTRTNGQGHFRMSLQGDEERHVLTISKDRYQLLSRIVQAPLTGGESRFRLRATRNFVVDPATGISIVDRPRRDGQRGAAVSIAPSSLAPMRDRSRATAEPLVASVITIDPADPDSGLPGDGGAANARGERVRMESLGAVEVEFRDAAGNLYNLIDGRTAIVRIPVNPERARRGDLPASAPVWFYDVVSGLWREDGLARLAGNFYEAVAKHFSTISVGPPQPNGVTCARVRTSQMMVNNGVTSYITMPYDVMVTVTHNGIPNSVIGTIDNPLSAIINLPVSSTNSVYTVTIQALNSDHTLNTHFPSVNFTTDNEPIPNGVTPTYPFDVCRSHTTALIAAIRDQFGGRTDANFAPMEPAGGFLNYRFGAGSSQTAAQYYAQIDPGSERLTFAAWKIINGFDTIPPDPNDSAEAIYFNDGDLGFGRWMNMRRRPALTPNNYYVAYYVSNYKDADKAIAAKMGPDPTAGLIATVAMEYSPIGSASSTPVTKFYVFNAAGNRVDNADLDGNGIKYVPHLCVICHGGSVPPAPTPPPADLSARFIGFDLHTFAYSSNPQFTRAVQESQFKTLNARVLDTVPLGCSRDPQYGYTGDYRTICALIEGWYGGQGLPNPTQNDNFIPNVTSGTEPQSWSYSPQTQNLYLQAVVYCRSCHSTRPASLDWGTYSLVNGTRGHGDGDGGIPFQVCGQQASPYGGRNMPQAYRTWYNFWTSTGPANDFSPHAPFVLRDGLNPPIPNCKPPPPFP